MNVDNGFVASRALARRHCLVEAQFDPKIGSPTKVSVAWSEAEDDFFSFEVVGFKAD
jgi:hypothetical protein